MRLQFRFFRRTGDIDSGRGADFRVQHQLHFSDSKRLDRMIEHDCRTRHLVAGFGKCGGNIARRHRAIKRTRMRSLPDQHHRHIGHGFGFDPGGIPPLRVFGFDLRPFGFEFRLIAIGCAQGLAARQQKIARKAGLHPDDIANVTELFHTFEKDDVHSFDPSYWAR